MSAVLQIPQIFAAAASVPMQTPKLSLAVHQVRQATVKAEALEEEAEEPIVSYAFYRKHTERLLRRYLYASTQVGRSPNLLADSVGRGWVSSRRVRTFEDALIFVLDIERCLKKLSTFDRQMITRILLQDYTHTEAAVLLGVSPRTLCTKLPKAVDQLTELLVESNILIID